MSVLLAPEALDSGDSLINGAAVDHHRKRVPQSQRYLDAIDRLIAQRILVSDQKKEPVAVGDRDVSSALRNLRALGTIGGQFAEEIGRTGAKAPLQTIEETRLDILEGMGDTAGDVAASFEVLSDNVRATTYAELARAYVPRLPPADDADVEAFANTSAGKLLVPEWGDDAGRRLAIALFRGGSILDADKGSKFNAD